MVALGKKHLVEHVEIFYDAGSCRSNFFFLLNKLVSQCVAF